jgi:hypothetical protein
VAPQIFNRLKGEGCETQPLGQSAQDFPVGVSVEAARYGPLAQEETRLQASFGRQDALPLEVGGQRQNHIGKPGGVRAVESDGDQEFQFLKNPLECRGGPENP